MFNFIFNIFETQDEQSKLLQEDLTIKEIDPEKLLNYKNKLIKNFEINELDIKSFVNNVEIEQNQNIQAQSFFCCICSLFAHEPLICQQCENAISCQGCFENWKKSKNGISICPVCKFKDQSPRKLMKISLNMRDEIQVKCQQPECPFKNQLMKFSDFYQHINKCQKKESKCPNDCDQTFNSIEQGIKHYSSCSKQMIQCTDCNQEFKRDQKQNHFQECLKKEIFCNYCNTKLQRADMQTHVQNECEELEVACQFCNQQQLKRKSLKDHLENICPESSLLCSKCEGPYLRKNQISHDCIEHICKQMKQQQIQIQYLTDQNKKLQKSNKDFKKQNNEINNKIQNIQQNLINQQKSILSCDQIKENLNKEHIVFDECLDKEEQFERYIEKMREARSTQKAEFEKCPIGHDLEKHNTNQRCSICNGNSCNKYRCSFGCKFILCIWCRKIVYD